MSLTRLCALEGCEGESIDWVGDVLVDERFGTGSSREFTWKSKIQTHQIDYACYYSDQLDPSPLLFSIHF